MADALRVSVPPARPVAIFDGSCWFCRYWIVRWRERTGNMVEYRPFQDPAHLERFPELPRARCARAVHLVHSDGRVVAGGQAVFDLLALAGPTWPAWAYARVPGFRRASEFAYRRVSNHRSFAARLTIRLWGPVARPPTYALARWVFFRLLGLVYLFAFWSVALQVRGLIGQDGILPAREYLAGVTTWMSGHGIGLDRFRMVPTLFWFGTSDAWLVALPVAGMLLAALLAVGLAPMVLLPLLWIGYLSLAVVSGEFLSYQWDALLLETGFLAIWFAPPVLWDRRDRATDPPWIARWLLWWLLFRLMFGSGIVKLASGDPTWRGLDALRFHYETQPLPTVAAWYAHGLPVWFHTASTAVVLAVELAVPWLFVAPRRLRTLACLLLVGLQLLIAATGNYAFFNLLSVALCLLLLDDVTLMRVAPGSSGRAHTAHRAAGTRAHAPAWVLVVVALVTVPVSLVSLAGGAGMNVPGSDLVLPLERLVAPFRSVNGYGLFAVMTTTRPQIVVEGSEDDVTWHPYAFRYQPDDRRAAPRWVAPFQPRLDWQLWFAALGRYDQEVWFQRFCARLLEASPPVLGLLESDPFNGRRPRLVRARLYQYHFADAETRRRDGVWWTRDELGLFAPVLSLAAGR